MGQIRKRGTFYQIRYYRNGRRIEEATGFTKWEEARGLLREREGAIEKGVPITANSTRLTFDDAVKDVVADYTVNGKRSKDDVQRRITLHLMPYFGGKRLSAISVADIRAFAATRLADGASHAEINRELAIVKRAFRLAIEAEKYHGRVPKTPMLQERNVRQGFFDDVMVEAVLAELPEPLRPVIRFAYITGWRVQSEVLPMEWRHVDRETGEVRLDPGTTKNQAGRVFPFSHALLMLFDEQWAAHEALRQRGTICRYVFHRRGGKRIQGFRKAWARACRDAGYPGMLVHDLRRSAVRNMERCGLSRSVAMQLTGHKTEAVYRRYAITCEADLREGVDRLNGAMGTNRAIGSKFGVKRSQASGGPGQQSA
jgi:integrase